MKKPLYNINDVVYIKESAAIGHLEAVRMSGIHMYNNEWVYTITVGSSNLKSPALYGDRVSQISTETLYFAENEFVTICDALILAEANALRALQKIQLQRASLCPESITG